MTSLKKHIKNFLFKKGIRIGKPTYKKYILHNIFNTSFERNILLIHLTEPFISGMSYKHTAFAESVEIASAFKSLCYNVDVINYNDDEITLEEIDVEKYFAVFGQGYAMDKIFSHPKINQIKTIIYATGCHTFYLNTNAFVRLKQNYQSTHKYLVDSMIFNRYLFPLQISISDYMFVWGNEFTKSTYVPYYIHNPENIICISAFFHKTINIDLEKKDFKKSSTSFLFFGSSGLIHRGLDLLIDYFSQHLDLTLHVCGSIFQENAFYETYKPKLDASKNIIVHGFVDITTPIFQNILEQTNFYIYPSASEGTSASALTVIGNGGLVPILTKQCSLDVQDFGIIIEEINLEGIDKAVKKALSFSEEEVITKSKRAYQYINSHHSVDNFRTDLVLNLKKIGL